MKLRLLYSSIQATMNRTKSVVCRLAVALGLALGLAVSDLSARAATFDGEIVGWGWDINENLSTIPEDSGHISVAAGESWFSAAVGAEGIITLWGRTSPFDEAEPIDNGFIKVACGRQHGVGLRADGSLAAFGTNYWGTLDNTPTQSDFVAVDARAFYSLALTSDGTIVGWGNRVEHGALLDAIPVGTGFAAIAAGYHHGLAINNKGEIVVWGYAYEGMSKVPLDSEYVAVAAGRWHSLALKADGTLVSWGVDDGGEGDYGQVRDTPTGNDFVAIACGVHCSFALRADGSIVAWGGDSNWPSPYEDFWEGEPEHGMVTLAPKGPGYASLSVGAYHAFALTGIPEDPRHNQPPVAFDVEAQTDEDVPVAIELLATDPEGDPLEYVIVQPPSFGVLTGEAPSLVYTPAVNYNGLDSLVFLASNGALESDPATVTITIHPVNDPPVFITDPVVGPTAVRGDAYAASVAGTVYDPDLYDDDSEEELSFGKVSGPVWLVVGTDGALSGVPASSDTGLNTFVIQVTDTSQASAQATLEINVVTRNRPPQFTQDPVILPDAAEDVAYVGSLAGSAIDQDKDDTLSFEKVSGPAWLTLSSDGTVTGTPGETDLGENAFNVRVTDSAGATADAVLLIQVVPFNHPPVFTANPIERTAIAGVSYSGSIAGTAFDPDPDDSLVYSAAELKPKSWLTVAAGGTLSGTPHKSTKSGTVFTLTVYATDTAGASAEAILLVTVLQP